jgi:hypothetical protein
MNIRNFASAVAFVGLLTLGCDDTVTDTEAIPQTQPPITQPPVTDPDPAQRHGAGSGNFVDPGPSSPITVPDGTTTNR